MCLSKIISRNPRKSGIGYKYFGDSDRKDFVHPFLYSPSRFEDKKYKLRKWYKSSYGPGFHVYTAKDMPTTSGYDEELYKVRYRGAVAQGIVNCPRFGKAILAQEIMILGKVKP